MDKFLRYENPKIQPVFAKMADLATFSRLYAVNIKILNRKLAMTWAYDDKH